MAVFKWVQEQKSSKIAIFMMPKALINKKFGMVIVYNMQTLSKNGFQKIQNLKG